MQIKFRGITEKKSPTAATTIKLYTSVIALFLPVLQSMIDFIKKLYPLYKKTQPLYIILCIACICC